MALTPHPSIFVHPGPWLKTEIVEAHKVGVSAVAAAFGVSRQSLSALLNGRSSLSADMAVRFEKLFGIGADTLMRMQVSYDLSQVRMREDGIVVDHSRLAA